MAHGWLWWGQRGAAGGRQRAVPKAPTGATSTTMGRSAQLYRLNCYTLFYRATGKVRPLAVRRAVTLTVRSRCACAKGSAKLLEVPWSQTQKLSACVRARYQSAARRSDALHERNRAGSPPASTSYPSDNSSTPIYRLHQNLPHMVQVTMPRRVSRSARANPSVVKGS